MNLNTYVLDRLNKIATAKVVRGEFPDKNSKLVEFLHNNNIARKEWVALKGDYAILYKQLIVNAIKVDSYEDITIWRNLNISYNLVEVKSERQIYVHKSVVRILTNF